ncbi:hypothetical protein EGR_10546 [Echinococcus granulosus]|uniref:Uncharacterized protein n=1 Tax=Echinococcus granulosus TaxID=6210 RepID=W6U874_ECHGR|nr:hypothetical protein EGR_10546 [Echinococcus granulosus]EUB54592.1 hypothetical protein EGR_10546 [Echinococcus granulosus]
MATSVEELKALSNNTETALLGRGRHEIVDEMMLELVVYSRELNQPLEQY